MSTLKTCWYITQWTVEICTQTLWRPSYMLSHQQRGLTRVCFVAVRGGFCDFGAPGKYRNGALYICTYVPRSTLRILFCHDACCCTMVPHSCVQYFYIFHVYVIKMIISFTFIHLADPLFFHVVDHEIAIDLPSRYTIVHSNIKT